MERRNIAEVNEGRRNKCDRHIARETEEMVRFAYEKSREGGALSELGSTVRQLSPD
jgi:hypothetical protein